MTSSWRKAIGRAKKGKRDERCGIQLREGSATNVMLVALRAAYSCGSSANSAGSASLGYGVRPDASNCPTWGKSDLQYGIETSTEECKHNYS